MKYGQQLRVSDNTDTPSRPFPELRRISSKIWMTGRDPLQYAVTLLNFTMVYCLSMVTHFECSKIPMPSRCNDVIVRAASRCRTRR